MAWWRSALALAIGLAIVSIPFVHYRHVYQTEHRFREVSAGRFYRAGQMSADVLRHKLREHRIRLVVNLQDEHPDPLLPSGYWDAPHVTESRVCAEEGARFVVLRFGNGRDRVPRTAAGPANRPGVIDDFLALCDDPANYPILVHCWAGRHRTGLLTAVYRMEYEGWPVADAARELRANGFGDRNATTANDYVLQYLYLYEPRARGPRPSAGGGRQPN